MTATKDDRNEKGYWTKQRAVAMAHATMAATMAQIDLILTNIESSEEFPAFGPLDEFGAPENNLVNSICEIRARTVDQLNRLIGTIGQWEQA